MFLFLTFLSTKGLCEERGTGGVAEGEKKRGAQVKGLDEVPLHTKSWYINALTQEGSMTRNSCTVFQFFVLLCI